jgi:predicted metal-dependent peptidase
MRNIIEEALGIVNNIWSAEDITSIVSGSTGKSGTPTPGPEPHEIDKAPGETGKPEDKTMKPVAEPGKIPTAPKSPPVKRPNPRSPHNIDVVELTPEQVKEIKDAVRDMVDKSDKHIYDKIPGKDGQKPGESKSDTYRARTEEEQRGGGGDPGHGDCKRVWSEMLKSKLDWKEHLKDFVTTLVKRTQPDRGRFRKRPLVHDEFRFKRKKIYGAKILVCVDTSGSISPTDYNKFISELFSIFEDYGDQYDVTINMLYWDTEVSAIPVTFDKDNYEEILKYPSQKTGGNRVTCVLEWIMEKQDERTPDGIIYFTDGYEESHPKLFPANHSLLVLTFDGTPTIMGPFVDEVVYLDDNHGGKR